MKQYVFYIKMEELVKKGSRKLFPTEFDKV